MKISFLCLILGRFVFAGILGAGLLAPLAGFAAAPLCADVLSAKAVDGDFLYTEVLKPYADGLDVERFEKVGYTIKNGFLIDTKTNTQLGSIKVFQPKHLFQWADAEFHKDVVENNGIFKEWMDQFLEELPQAAGRGFYISTNPLDSIGFGDSVSIFKVEKPIYVLKMIPQKIHLISMDIKKTKTLAALGIDAVTYVGYSSSWFSFISNRHLESVEKVFPIDSIRESMNENISPNKSLVYLNRGQLPLILSFFKKLDPEFPDLAILNWINNGHKLEEVVPFYKTSSDILKILVSAIYYNKSNYEGRHSDKAKTSMPPEMFSFLLEGVKNQSKPEIIMMVQFWNLLTPEQEAQASQSPEILYLKEMIKTVEGG